MVFHIGVIWFEWYEWIIFLYRYSAHININTHSFGKKARCVRFTVQTSELQKGIKFVGPFQGAVYLVSSLVPLKPSLFVSVPKLIFHWEIGGLCLFSSQFVIVKPLTLYHAVNMIIVFDSDVFCLSIRHSVRFLRRSHIDFLCFNHFFKKNIPL